jgi:hypothetical protein
MVRFIRLGDTTSPGRFILGTHVSLIHSELIMIEFT